MATYTTALAGSYITPLILPESGDVYSTVRYYVPYSAIQVASSTASGDVITLTLGTTPTNWVVPSAYAWVASGFAGTSVTSVLCTVGTTTNVACFLASTQVSGAVTGNLIQATNGINTTNAAASSTGTTSLTTVAQFTLQGAGANSLSAGALQIVISYKDLTATY